MKKILILFVLSIFNISLSAQKLLSAEVWYNRAVMETDSTVYCHVSHKSYYDKATDSFMLNPDTLYHYISGDPYKHIYTYNAAGFPVEILVQSFISGSFVNLSRELITYNAGQRIDLSVMYFWDPDEEDWYESHKTINHYDSKMNQLNSLSQSLNSDGFLEDRLYHQWVYNTANQVISRNYRSWTGTQWIDLLKEYYVYYMDGRLRSFVSQDFNNITGELLSIDSTSLLYGTNSKLYLSLKYQYDLNNLAYNHYEKLTYNYNSDSTMSTEKNYAWYVNEWLLQKTFEYSYDTDKKLSETIRYDGQDLVPKEKYEYTYNTFGNPRYEIFSAWNGAWINSSMQEYSYDSEGDLIHYADKTWYNGNWVQKDMSWQAHYYYTFKTSLPETKSVSFSIYPNPAHSHLNISWTDKLAPDYIVLCDLQGKELMRLNTDRTALSASMNIEALSPGIYFLYLFDPRGLSGAEKFIKR